MQTCNYLALNANEELSPPSTSHRNHVSDSVLSDFIAGSTCDKVTQSSHDDRDESIVRPRIGVNRRLSSPACVPEMRSRRDTGRDAEHARARANARLRRRGGDDEGGREVKKRERERDERGWEIPSCGSIADAFPSARISPHCTHPLINSSLPSSVAVRCLLI